MENCCLFVNHLSTWGRRPGEGKRDLENNVGLAYVFIYKLKPIAPATRDTQAYVNILFPSYYFVFFFFLVIGCFCSFIRNFQSAQNFMGVGRD